MVIAQQGLRRSVDGNGPAIGDTPFVDPLPEVSDQEVSTHLEVGDRALEVFLPALAEAGPPFQGKGEPLVLPGKAVHDPLLPHGSQLVLPAAVKVIAVPPPVGKVGKPGLGDEAGLFPKKLAVGHLTAPSHEATPLPGVLLRITGPPVEGGGVLLHREASHLILEQGQKANLIDPAYQLLPALDAGGIIPSHAPHDPLAVLNGHEIPPSTLLP